MWAAVRPYYANTTTRVGVNICVAMYGEGWYVFYTEKRTFRAEKYIRIFLHRQSI